MKKTRVTIVNPEKMAERYADPTDPNEARIYMKFLNAFRRLNDDEINLMLTEDRIIKRFHSLYQRYKAKIEREVEEYKRAKQRQKEIAEEKFDAMMINMILAHGFVDFVKSPEPITYAEKMVHEAKEAEKNKPKNN